MLNLSYSLISRGERRDRFWLSMILISSFKVIVVLVVLVENST